MVAGEDILGLRELDSTSLGCCKLTGDTRTMFEIEPIDRSGPTLALLSFTIGHSGITAEC